MEENSQKLSGLVRSVVQVLVVALLTKATPLLDVLGVDAAALQALIIAAVMGLYWLAMDTLQASTIVRETPILRLVVALLMGGDKRPNYVDTTVIDI